MSVVPSFNQLAGIYGEDHLLQEWDLRPCPECNGDGGGEALPTGPHDTGRWVACLHCGGTGSVDSAPAGIEHTEDAAAIRARGTT